MKSYGNGVLSKRRHARRSTGGDESGNFFHLLVW